MIYDDGRSMALSKSQRRRCLKLTLGIGSNPAWIMDNERRGQIKGVVIHTTLVDRYCGSIRKDDVSRERGLYVLCDVVHDEDQSRLLGH